jgi:hypothetical protein
MTGSFALLFLLGACILWIAAGVGVVRLINWRWVRKTGRPFFHQDSVGDIYCAVLVTMIWPLVLCAVALSFVFVLLGVLCTLIGAYIIGGE